MLRLTPVIKNLLIINCVVFLAKIILPEVDISGCFPGMFEGRLDTITAYLSLYNIRSDCFKPYQLFTYMFVHGGGVHLFFNMLILATTGPILETFWGPKRFLLFYLVTGIGAGVFNLLIDYFIFPGGSFGFMVGASGAIYGILMGFGMLFPNMEVMLLIPPMPVKAKYLVWILGALTFFMGGANVAHLAHLGGIIFAFLMIRLWRSQGGGRFY